MTVTDLIWSGGIGALAGAIVTLVTTLLNNKGQNRRQVQQLEHDILQRTRQLQHDTDQRKAQFAHDSEQRRTERERGLRREVYLNATAAIGQLQDFISSYARQDISESDKLAIIQGSMASLNKVHLVGTNRTIEAFTAAQFAFAKCSFRLGEIKLETIKTNIDIEQLQRDLRLLEKKREGILETARNPGFAPQQEALAEVRSSLLALDGEIEKVSDNLGQAQHRLFKLQMTLSKESAQCIVEMMDAFSKAVLTVREELRIDLNIEAYQAFMEAERMGVREEFEAFLKRISARVGDAGE
jgi:hypothetical protein